MSEPLLEKYEQLLSRDPASPAFIDWAKALIERRDHAQATLVLTRGLSHHPDSIVAHVLLGRCHLELARPAEAMSAFDRAIALEPENPYAYNLISEVLLEKGMHRPALPLLKKAVALQPNDGKIRQWLMDAQNALEASGASPPPPNPEDPFDDVARRTTSKDSDGESTVVFNPNLSPDDTRPAIEVSKARGPQPGGDPFDVVVSSLSGKAAAPPEPGEMTQAFDTLANRESAEQTVIPSPDLLTARASTSERKKPESLFPDMRSSAEGQSDFITIASSHGEQAEAGLLPDVPALEDTNPGTKTGINLFTTQETEAVAREYELELRRQMAEEAAAGTFFKRHGTRILLSVMALLIGMAFAVAYLQTQSRNRGLDLADHLAEARKALAQDTAKGYRQGLKSLAAARQMSPEHTESLLWSAYAYAVLYAEHGGLEEDRKSALYALSQPGIREADPGLSLVVSYLVALPNQKARLKRDVLASKFDHSEVEELAGRLLLADKKAEEAWKRLSRAVQLKPGNVRALVGLGQYYLAFQDAENALQVLDGNAARLSKEHPERVLGAAEARLQLRRDLEASLAEVKAMVPEEVPDLQLGRRQRVLGQLYSATNRHPEALEVLAEGLKQFEGQGLEFGMALARAAVAAGRMGEAQRALETALDRSPSNEEALLSLGRVLLAKDREREVLQLPGDSRAMALLRGIAWAQLKEWKKARIELHRTQVDGKYPPEAVVYLALADGFEGDGEKAVEMLQKVLVASKTARSEVHLALGILQWKRGQLPKAREHLESAAKEPTNYEGACSMGRLLLELNLPDLAVTPLQLAVSRNDSHHEAHAALQKVLDMLGRYGEATVPAGQWARAHPERWEAHHASARALYLNGRFDEAETVITAAAKVGASQVPVHRLRAMIAFARGQTKKAFAALEQANRLNPRDAETFCEIGHGFMRSGQKENAQAAFAAAVREDPRSVCGNAGTVWVKLPAVGPQAVRDLADGSKSATDGLSRAFAETVRARALLANGALREARVAADTAVRLTPFSGQAHWVLAQVAVKQGEDAAAWQAYEKAVQYEPSSSPIQLAFADQYSRGKDRLRLARAVRAYEAFLEIGGVESDVKRVQRELPQLKKRLE